MDKEKVKWCLENLEILVSILKEELSEKQITTNSFENIHPIDADDDIEYYEEED